MTGTMDKHEGDKFEINDQQKWTGQELGVNSNIPLVDAGTGRQYIIREFKFNFNPQFIKDVADGKAKVDRQALFNSHWRQIETELWKDGMVARRDVDPRIIFGKRKYKIILVCEPRLGTMIADKARTLQELTPHGKIGKLPSP